MDKPGFPERKRASGGRAGSGQVFGAEPGFRGMGRVFEAEPGFWMGQNMTPGEILPGAQKSGPIFDSCPGSGTMQGVLDWVRAGLPEDRGHKEYGYGWSGGMSWRGGRWQWCKEEAGGGCGGRKGKGGAERGFCWSLQDFEEEGVAGEENEWRHWKEGQKLGGGAHQGQRGWSKTTGATDFFKEAPDLEDVRDFQITHPSCYPQNPSVLHRDGYEGKQDSVSWDFGGEKSQKMISPSKTGPSDVAAEFDQTARWVSEIWIDEVVCNDASFVEKRQEVAMTDQYVPLIKLSPTLGGQCLEVAGQKFRGVGKFETAVEGVVHMMLNLEERLLLKEVVIADS
ncbi:hypothetical protein PPACK8108_LOCUS22491 [Phakopsora pachyrhizi]|uniref:Uncharacterized protein n=1 Tax=Phakopsora pachyrhizi TaxID=170000 RepID=A0AAV0BPZ8_PHAPC|nr:hypothetical protein PPACK8108_LOCUS22491 [Phakopsora pachyrhizi]